MELSVWITYFIATIILSLTPGPGVFSSVSQRAATTGSASGCGTASACRSPT